MNEFDLEHVKNLLRKIKGRDEIFKKYYRNLKDIGRLQEGNKIMMDKVKELDMEILVMAKPKGE